jgi:uncharacterized membrane protein
MTLEVVEIYLIVVVLVVVVGLCIVVFVVVVGLTVVVFGNIFQQLPTSFTCYLDHVISTKICVTTPGQRLDFPGKGDQGQLDMVD